MGMKSEEDIREALNIMEGNQYFEPKKIPHGAGGRNTKLQAIAILKWVLE